MDPDLFFYFFWGMPRRLLESILQQQCNFWLSPGLFFFEKSSGFTSWKSIHKTFGQNSFIGISQSSYIVKHNTLLHLNLDESLAFYFLSFPFCSLKVQHYWKLWLKSSSTLSSSSFLHWTCSWLLKHLKVFKILSTLLTNTFKTSKILKNCCLVAWLLGTGSSQIPGLHLCFGHNLVRIPL